MITATIIQMAGLSEMIDDFMGRATLAGLGVAVASSPLGCFVVWRRMAYFGDATAHAAILGVAFSLAFSLPVFAGALAVALLMAIAITALGGGGYSTDTLLGVLAHSSLAAGLVAVSFLGNVRVDLMSYLFGDILAVGKSDLALIWLGAVIVLCLIAWRWSPMLTATLDPDLARAGGINPEREKLILNLSLAIVVAVAIKVVGVLLISAMLIIPAAAARPFSRTPEQMVLIAAIAGIASVLAGLRISFVFDTPTGPTIVCVAAAIFALSNLVGGTLARFRS